MAMASSETILWYLPLVLRKTTKYSEQLVTKLRFNLGTSKTFVCYYLSQSAQCSMSAS